MQSELAFLKAGVRLQHGLRAEAGRRSVVVGGGEVQVGEAGDFERGISRLRALGSRGRHGDLIVVVCRGSAGRLALFQLRDAFFQAIDAVLEAFDERPRGRVHGPAIPA